MTRPPRLLRLALSARRTARREEIIIGKQWRWTGVAVAVLVAIAMGLWLHARSASFDWTAFAATFSRLDGVWLALGCAMAYASYYGRALRWAIFLQPLRPQAGIWDLMKATLIGFTAIILVGRPGELVRPYLISVKENVPLSSQLAAWFLERVFDLLFTLLIFGYGLNRVQSSQAQVGRALQWTFQVGGGAVWILSGICLILLFLLRQYPALFRRRLIGALSFLPSHRLAKLDKMITAFLQGVESLRGSRSLALVIAFSALTWVLIAASCFCVIKSFGGVFQFGVIDTFIYLGFVAFGSIIQLPGIGGGMQVVSVLVLHELFGASVEMASSITLAVWITITVVILPVGIPLALHEGLSWRKIKVIQKESSL